MAIFVVIAQPDANGERLAGVVQAIYPGRHMLVGPGVWLVADRGTPLELSNRLGISTGANGAAIIIEAAGYYGRATTGVWDWFRANWGGASGG